MKNNAMSDTPVTGDTFCTHCFTRLASDEKTCPACGRVADAPTPEDYPQRLVNALHHPLSEVRMRAIIAIGWRHDRSSANALVACSLRNPSDIVEGLQIVESLSIIDGGKPHAIALHYLAARHPAGVVKQAALAATQDAVVNAAQTKQPDPASAGMESWR